MSRSSIYCVAALLVAVFFPGCKKAPPALPELTSAGEVLERMVAAYHEAKGYQDNARVQLHFNRENGKDKVIDQDWDYSVAFARPNKLRMHVYQAVVVSDGKKLHAALNLDEVRGQILDISSPDKLTSQNIFDADPLLGQVLSQGGAAGPPLVLPLLLEEAALDPVLEGAEKPTLLPPEKVEGESCYRIEVQRPDGRLVFWIDQKSFVLRRIEYPTEEFRKGVEEKEGKVDNLSLTVEFAGATLNGEIEPAAFQFETPADARLVQQFLVPPPLLGQRIGDFKFRGLDGQEITRESLAGKVAVIDFWATWCEPCLKSLPNLQRVADRYAGNENLVFLAVSVDNDEVNDDAVRQKFAETMLSLPLARDPSIAARDVFAVESLPTMVVLSGDGAVQDYENVFDPELADTLPPKLDKLLAGGSIFEETLQQYTAPGPTGSASEVQVAVASVAEPSEPKKLRMSTLWSCREVKSPGNMLAIDDEQGRVLVLDNWQTVVELDAEGHVSRRHKLDLPKQPEESVVSFLRTAVDGRGRRFFLGSANGVQQLFVFDADWQRLAVFPTGGTHPGITDIQLADLDGDGVLEINVGFWGPTAVQNVSLDGELRWINKSCENVLRLAVAGDQSGKQSLLATTALGNVVPIDEQGQEGKPLGGGKRFVQLVFTADLNGDGMTEICAIGPSKTGEAMLPGENAVIGLSAEGEVLWQYDLPAGVPANGALEYVASGNLLSNRGQWVVAGPDGSIHIISADGKLIDRFNTGVSLSGLAVAQLNGQPALVISSPEGVEARTFQK
ncbi:MAG TPA: thioredoxin-like domain-containing protein [Pirellulales bacterium]|nr:thioredoxin-like domain-containing protein [Pirellulales bacterium]